MYAHVPWASADAAVGDASAFPAPAFDETSKDSPAIDISSRRCTSARPPSSTSGWSSAEQKVDAARRRRAGRASTRRSSRSSRGVKKPADAVYVRDEILATFASARAAPVPAQRAGRREVEPAATRFARTLDNTERIAVDRSRASRAYQRSYDTVNNYYRTLDSLTPADLQAAAPQVLHRRRAGRHDAVEGSAAGRHRARAGARVAQARAGIPPPRAAGRAGAATPAGATRRRDPPGPAEIGAAAARTSSCCSPSAPPTIPTARRASPRSTAAMIAEAGSRAMTHRRDRRRRSTRWPASFGGAVDKEMTTFTGVIHRDHWDALHRHRRCRSCSSPGFREEDFKRAQGRAAERARPGSALEQRGGARQGAAADEHLPRHAVRPRRARHRRRHQGHHARRREGSSRARRTRARNLTVGISGDAPDEMVAARCRSALAQLPAGSRRAARPAVAGDAPSGHRGGDPREGHARDRDLVRASRST